jgi:hypothetical protein
MFFSSMCFFGTAWSYGMQDADHDRFGCLQAWCENIYSEAMVFTRDWLLRDPLLSGQAVCPVMQPGAGSRLIPAMIR